MKMTIKKRGRLFVLSAPSGGGKSSLKNMIIPRLPDLLYSVSYTTRAPRAGEEDGRDYYFVSRDDFEDMIKHERFLEWAEVFGRYYGTGKARVEDMLDGGHDVLADLDVAGASSVKALMPEAVLIFMVPPTTDELKKRLNLRQTESSEEARVRLSQVRREVGCRGIYDFLIINDDLNQAVEDMVAIINEGQGRRMADSEYFWPGFFSDGDA